MLSVLLNSVYIDSEWVAEEYLRRCKKGESLKCFNLECVLEAEELGMEVPKEMAMDVYAGEVVDLSED